MSIFILFVSAGILFEVNFSLRVSLKKELSWKTFGNGVTGVFLWSEGYSNSSQISKVDRFANIVGGFQPLTDIIINYLRCFSRFWIHLWWDLQNFSEQLLCRTFVDGCFYHLLTEENSTFIVTDVCRSSQIANILIGWEIWKSVSYLRKRRTFLIFTS